MIAPVTLSLFFAAVEELEAATLRLCDRKCDLCSFSLSPTLAVDNRGHVKTGKDGIKGMD